LVQLVEDSQNSFHLLGFRALLECGMSPHKVSSVFAALLCAVASGCSAAQKTYTIQDYTNAEQRLGWNVSQLMDGFVASPAYLPDGRVFYSEGSTRKYAYFIADPAHGTKVLAFDSEKLAAALSGAGKDKVQATQLRVSSYMPEPNGFSVETAQGKFHCNTAAAKCTREPDPPPPVPIPQKPGLAASTTTAKPAAPPARGRRRSSPENASPDKKLVAFIRDNNLWVRTVATGQERQLRPMVLTTSATRPTTQVGNTPTCRYLRGQTTARKLPRFSSISARPA